ncbi:hypothetical protein [Massilia sp. PWRC2]|uniref:hypothetical protein n=1 Tax=Massilia sp. PWRC2 TaxID=2804626 RepID=UPI003CF1AACE
MASFVSVGQSSLVVPARALARHAAYLLLIAIALAGGRLLLQPARSGPQLADASNAALRSAVAARARAMTDVAGAAQATAEHIDERIASMRRALVRDAAQPLAASLSLQGPAQIAERLERRYERALRLEIGRQQVDYLLRVRAWAAGAAGGADTARKHEQLRAAVIRTYLDYMSLKSALAQLHPIARIKFSFAAWQAQAQQRRQLDAAWLAFDDAYVALAAQESAELQQGTPTAPPVFVLDDVAIDNATAPLAARLAQVRAVVASHWLTACATPVLQQLPLALALLLAALLLPSLALRWRPLQTA